MARYVSALVIVVVLAAAAGMARSAGSARGNLRPGRDGLIAFVRGTSLYTVRPDGSDLRRLKIVPAVRYLYVDGPAWSPDGTRLAFVGHYLAGTLEVDALFVRDAAGHTESLTWVDPGEAGVSWSPDGKTIVVDSGGDDPELNLVIAATGKKRGIPGTGAYGSVPGFDPAWSPDGSWIAYRVGQGSVCSQGTCVLALHGVGVVRPDGSGLRQLTRLGGDPSWSPDGRRIAFTHLDRVGTIGTETTGAAEHGISVMDRDGTHLVRLTTQRGDCDPAWSPSGLYTVFSRGSALWIMRRDGTGQHRLVANGEHPAWQALK